jgi:hypothetical protein
MIPGNQHHPEYGQYGTQYTDRYGSGGGGSSRLRIGFSFWGFLGPGVLDTPDGGRFWRRPIVDALVAAGHQVVLLQDNRDAAEAADDLPYSWDGGFPEVDVLLAEWRWPLPGRNTTPCGTEGHTCDLHRQDDLVDHYARSGTATIIWDTDRQLPTDDPLRALANVVICEPAIVPSRGARTLLHPVPDATLNEADPAGLAELRRELPLVYVGNQYDRDEQFDEFFAPAAERFPHRVAGKWPRTQPWPHVTFTGRCPFGEVQGIYRSGLATVLLLPGRYARVGHQTQRLFEAVLAGCLPLTPRPIGQAAAFTPEQLHVRDGRQVVERVEWAQRIAGTAQHTDLIAYCLALLEPFRLSDWTTDLTTLMDELVLAAKARS